MTRFDIISKLEEAMEEISWASDLTEYARDKTYTDIMDAVEILKENEEI